MSVHYQRVLITGSRTWTDVAVIRAALVQVWHPDTVLVSGGCPRGADALCEQCWQAWGGQVERHRADWARHGRAAGYRRNTHLVAGAPMCAWRSSATTHPAPATPPPRSPKPPPSPPATQPRRWALMRRPRLLDLSCQATTTHHDRSARP
ncbi:MAG: DUF2493 domain-containing protein [Pseudonocardia sp.]